MGNRVGTKTGKRKCRGKVPEIIGFYISQDSIRA